MFEWLKRLLFKPRAAARPTPPSDLSPTARLIRSRAQGQEAEHGAPHGGNRGGELDLEPSSSSEPRPAVEAAPAPAPVSWTVDEQEFGGADTPEAVTKRSAAPAPSPARTEPGHSIRTEDQARAHLAKLNAKISALAERFAEGAINRTQFQQLYAHYQREIQSIEAVLTMDPNSEDWKKSVSEGQSMLIRKRAQAQVLGFSIYDKESGIPLRNMGKFGVDPALFVPMLSAYRSATEEIFGGGVRSTQIEGGKWLSFVPGKVTTTLALFTMEPSNQQIKALEDLQVLFENANANTLGKPGLDPASLVCPHEFFIDHSL